MGTAKLHDPSLIFEFGPSTSSPSIIAINHRLPELLIDHTFHVSNFEHLCSSFNILQRPIDILLHLEIAESIGELRPSSSKLHGDEWAGYGR